MGYQLVLAAGTGRAGVAPARIGTPAVSEAISCRRRMAFGLITSAPAVPPGTVGGLTLRPKPRLSHSCVIPCQTPPASLYSTRKNPSTKGKVAPATPRGVFQFASVAVFAKATLLVATPNAVPAMLAAPKSTSSASRAAAL